MSTLCCCGCGRTITGVRLRAANGVGLEMSGVLDVLQGTLDNGEAGDHLTEVTASWSEGTELLTVLTRYLHGDLSRGDIDKGATTDWLRRSRALSGSLAAWSSGPTWLPDDHATDGLGPSGTRAPGIVTDVRRAGWGNERVADLEMAVAITTPEGADLVLRRTLSIAVVEAPRVGDRVEVAYDAADPNRFVYRPRLDDDGGPSA